MPCIAPQRPTFEPRGAAMRRLPGLACAAALATAAGPAWAELTAEEVWQGWQDLAAGSGQRLVAASSDRDGDTLTARGVTLAGTGDGTTLLVELDEIAFTETGDGTVAVRMSDAYDIVLEGGFESLLRLGVSHPGLRLEVSQVGQGLRHDLSAPEIAVQLQELSGPETADHAEVSLSALRVTGHYEVTRDAQGTTMAEIEAGALDLDMSLRDADDALDLDFAATGVGLSFLGAALESGGAQIGMGDMAGALARGFALQFGLDFETQRYAVLSVEEGEATSVEGRSTNGRTRFSLDGQEVSFSTSSRNGEITMPAEVLVPALAEGLGAAGLPAGTDMDETLTLRAGEIAYGASMPTGGSPEAQGATLLLRLMEVTAPEAVWTMIDPSGLVPRTPLTAVLDLTAQMVLPDDLFGMGTALGFMMGGPFEVVQPTALDIRELALRFGGAELTGGGAFLLDATDLETFDGLPRPEGALNLTLRGSDTLIETMVEAGLLPPDQANAARLLIALLGQPGEAPGELVSTIEIDEAGAVRTNGMRVR